MLTSRNAETAVTLDGYISDLNLEISQDRYSCQPMHKDGFAYMWAGAKATSGIRRGKVCYEVKIVENLQVTTSEFTDAHIVRVGWSTDAATLQLGEDKNSFGYGGTAKKSEGRKFSDYGRRFDAGDVIGCYLFMGGGWVDISYCVNGYQCGNAFKVRWNNDEALYPHVLTKNCRLEVNFGQAHNPYFSILPGYKFIGNTPPEARVFGAKAPSTKQECETIMMVGLPGVGKTTWAMNYAKLHSNKKYNILGTDAIIDKMRVQGLPRKDNFGGRWDVLIKQATECFNVMLRKASILNRNLILDQTNVYASARKRKARQYKDAGYRVHAMVLVPTDDEMISRSKHRTLTDGKEVPEAAINDMKANFSLPHENENLFATITFLELQRVDAENLVMQYNIDAGLKGYKSNKQSGYGGNENQKEKSEKLQFHEPPPPPPTMLTSSSLLKGKVDGEWQRADSRPMHSLDPTYHKNDLYEKLERKEHIPLGNTTFRDPIERRESDRDWRSTRQWAPYEKKDESSWWNKNDDKNEYSSGNGKDMQYPEDSFPKSYPPPSLMGGRPTEQNIQNRGEPSFNKRREQSWHMDRPEANEPGKLSGSDQRRATDNSSFSASHGNYERSTPFAQNDQWSFDDFKRPWQYAERNQPHQAGAFEDSGRTMWNNEKPIQKVPSHQDMGDFRDDDRPQHWEQVPRPVDQDTYNNRRATGDQRMNYSDSFKPQSDLEDWQDQKIAYGHKQAPDHGHYPPQVFRNDEDKFPHTHPEQISNQRYPGYELERKQFEPRDNARNDFGQNRQQPMQFDSTGRQQPATTNQRGRILDSIPPDLTGVDFDDLRATLANVRQQALQGKNNLFGRREQADEPYPRSQMVMEPQNQRPSHAVRNQPNSDSYFHGADQNRRMEKQHDVSGVENYPRMLDANSRMNTQPLLQHHNDGAKRDPAGRHRNDQCDRNRGRPDERFPSDIREDSKPVSDKKGSNSDRNYSRSERRDATRDAIETGSSRKDRRRSPERSSQSRVSSSRSQRSSRDDYRDKDDSRRRKSSPRRYPEKRSERGSGKEKDDFGRDPKQRRCTRSPDRSQRDGKDARAGRDSKNSVTDGKNSVTDGKNSVTDNSLTRVTDSRERDRSSNRGSRRDTRSPEIKQHSENERVPSRSRIHEKRDSNIGRKALLKTPGDFRESIMPPPPTETKFDRGPRNEPVPPKVHNPPRVEQRVPDKKPLLATPPIENVGRKPVSDRPDKSIPPQHVSNLPQQGEKYDGHFSHDFDLPNLEQRWAKELPAANQNMPRSLLGPRPPLAPGEMSHIPAEPFEEVPPSLLDIRPPLLNTPIHRFGDPRMQLQRAPRPRFPQGNRPPSRLEGMAMRPRMRPGFHPGGEGFPRPFNNADPRFIAMHEPGMVPGNNPRFPGPRHPMHGGPRPMRPGQPWRMPRIPRPGPPRPIRM